MSQEMHKLLKNEKKLRKKELRGTARPHTARAFERALLSSPFSSYLWLQYAAFHLTEQDAHSARGAISRALSTIPVEEQRERMNLYIGWINLEEAFGGAQEFSIVIESALASNDPLPIYSHIVRKYIQRDDLVSAEKLCHFLCKKFPTVLEN